MDLHELTLYALILQPPFAIDEIRGVVRQYLRMPKGSIYQSVGAWLFAWLYIKEKQIQSKLREQAAEQFTTLEVQANF